MKGKDPNTEFLRVKNGVSRSLKRKKKKTLSADYRD